MVAAITIPRSFEPGMFAGIGDHQLTAGFGDAFERCVLNGVESFGFWCSELILDSVIVILGSMHT